MICYLGNKDRGFIYTVSDIYQVKDCCYFHAHEMLSVFHNHKETIDGKD